MNGLFSALQLRGLTLPNRIVVSPMCQYCAADGLANSWHVAHLTQLAISGAGMLTIESTAVEPDGRITPGDLGLWSDDTEAALGTVIQAIRDHSRTPVALQLAHAGRKASSYEPWRGGQLIPVSEGGWETVAPSAIPHKEGEAAPVELTKADIVRLREAFVAATRRAARLGVDALELHGGHGYLIHQFLSPISNQRTDEYGGSLENRMRFLLEVFDAVRDAWPDERPLGVKLSASDWVEGGLDIDATVTISQALKAHGADWVVSSSGGISPLQKIAPAPGYQLPFAARVKQEAGLVSTAVGLITEPRQADEIIRSGEADLVAVARAMLNDPRWPWRAAAELGAKVTAPPQYWRALPQGHSDIFEHLVFGAR
ncbi:NADH:flavin oxidoreductase/NADH oxidase [Pseudomonas sp. SLFW]|uniref:NADH:flavin oxidoreductase/NADH oxidase n=1 Tax=Pseudomonas sp. SLFW TaxID=2683259 RepID=UPI0014129EAC|nr:NADH:flavin oxidoreductase/NADH oxidase [Pseudomonas sp. SLFW]NBB10221.1 oxidoreductase [Pseudomonas sp. SLFW]